MCTPPPPPHLPLQAAPNSARLTSSALHIPQQPRDTRAGYESLLDIHIPRNAAAEQPGPPVQPPPLTRHDTHVRGGGHTSSFTSILIIVHWTIQYCRKLSTIICCQSQRCKVIQRTHWRHTVASGLTLNISQSTPADSHQMHQAGGRHCTHAVHAKHCTSCCKHVT